MSACIPTPPRQLHDSLQELTSFSTSIGGAALFYGDYDASGFLSLASRLTRPLLKKALGNYLKDMVSSRLEALIVRRFQKVAPIINGESFKREGAGEDDRASIVSHYKCIDHNQCQDFNLANPRKASCLNLGELPPICYRRCHKGYFTRVRAKPVLRISGAVSIRPGRCI